MISIENDSINLNTMKHFRYSKKKLICLRVFKMSKRLNRHFDALRCKTLIIKNETNSNEVLLDCTYY